MFFRMGYFFHTFPTNHVRPQRKNSAPHLDKGKRWAYNHNIVIKRCYGWRTVPWQNRSKASMKQSWPVRSGSFWKRAIRMRLCEPSRAKRIPALAPSIRAFGIRKGCSRRSWSRPWKRCGACSCRYRSASIPLTSRRSATRWAAIPQTIRWKCSTTSMTISTNSACCSAARTGRTSPTFSTNWWISRSNTPTSTWKLSAAKA